MWQFAASEMDKATDGRGTLMPTVGI